MPMSRHYKCFKCGKEFEILWKNSDEAQNTATCSCKAKAKRLYGAQFHIDDWSPMTNDAQRDIEHFEKRAVKNGKYVDTRTMYREDRMKKDIPVNISEV